MPCLQEVWAMAQTFDDTDRLSVHDGSDSEQSIGMIGIERPSSRDPVLDCIKRTDDILNQGRSF
jgi:hypothetical protein